MEARFPSGTLSLERRLLRCELLFRLSRCPEGKEALLALRRDFPQEAPLIEQLAVQVRSAGYCP